MKKVLVPVLVLLALWMATSVMAAPALKIPVSGDFTGSLTAPPAKKWITNGGILIIKGAEGAGPLTGSFTGIMVFTGMFATDLNTGLGHGCGKWVSTDAYGTFEGTWITDVTGFVYVDGSSVGQGTGDYEGMILKNSFLGYNLYLGGYEGPDGVYFEWVGTILSTKGTPLP